MPKLDVISSQPDEYTFKSGLKNYELSNHLGNVLVALTDRKIAADLNSDTYIDFLVDYISITDYYPFGMQQVDRSWQGGQYRFGFQGQEADDEIWGEGNASFYKYRISDNRLGRFFAVDPLAPQYPWNSSYAFSENRLIDSRELEGLERIGITTNSFAPFDEFSFFYGDGKNRKFGDPLIYSAGQENYRLSATVNIDLLTTSIISNYTVPTTSTCVAGWPRATSESDFNYLSFHLGNPYYTNASYLSFAVSGNDDAILWGYNPGFIDVDVKMSFLRIPSVGGSSYLVQGYVTGDRFPANETYITINDKKLFLGVSAMDANSYMATYQLLSFPNEIMQMFKFIVHFNPDDSLYGVQLLDGTSYTADEWNAVFESLDPSGTKDGTNVKENGIDTKYDPD